MVFVGTRYKCLYIFGFGTSDCTLVEKVSQRKEEVLLNLGGISIFFEDMLDNVVCGRKFAGGSIPNNCLEILWFVNWI